MTMHGAKGLEFPVVFVVGMEENVFPHARALASLEQTEMEEERRLCYVAITRAKEKLFLSRANMRMLYGRTNRNMPSRFLKDIPEYLIEDLSRKTREQHSNYETKIHTIIEPKKIGPNDMFQIGDKVCHRKWGDGIVVGVKGSGDDLEYAVAFPEIGIKNLVAKYAPLERK